MKLTIPLEKNKHLRRQKAWNQDESDRMSKLQADGKARSRYSRGSQGRREDLDNVYFRSKWEANYARYLNLLKEKGQVFKWEFEPDTFWFEKIKRGVRSYTPDFKIWDKADGEFYYVEVKGWMDAKSKTKLKRMKKYHPEVKLVLFDADDYKDLKKWKRVIYGWED